MVVKKFNNYKSPRFSDMPIMVSAADLDLFVCLCNIAVWVCCLPALRKHAYSNILRTLPPKK